MTELELSDKDYTLIGVEDVSLKKDSNEIEMTS